MPVNRPAGRPHTPGNPAARSRRPRIDQAIVKRLVALYEALDAAEVAAIEAALLTPDGGKLMTELAARRAETYRAARARAEASHPRVAAAWAPYFAGRSPEGREL